MRPEELANRYEEMRAYAVGAVKLPVPRGLALLVRRGLAASCPPAPAPATGLRAVSASSAGASVQTDLVTAPVGMALSWRL